MLYNICVTYLCLWFTPSSPTAKWVSSPTKPEQQQRFLVSSSVSTNLRHKNAQVASSSLFSGLNNSIKIKLKPANSDHFHLSKLPSLTAKSSWKQRLGFSWDYLLDSWDAFFLFSSTSREWLDFQQPGAQVCNRKAEKSPGKLTNGTWKLVVFPENRGVS